MTLTLGQARAAGLRAPMGAVTPSPWPYFRDAKTPEQQQRLADALVKNLAPPGRLRIVALCTLLAACPLAIKPAALRVMRRCQPGHAGWQTLLLTSFIGSSYIAVDAAENRETRRAWFDQADLMRPAPFLAPYCYAAEELPETVTLYRGGGCDDVDFMQGGFSWSAKKTTAAWYARHRHAQGRQAEHGGPATILKMTIPIERVSLWTRGREAGVVVIDAEGAEVDTTCAETIHHLAEVANPIFESRSTPPASEVLRLSPVNDEGWHGGTGDE